MNELALFAGAGGGILGGQLLGWKTVCAVERDAYAAAVLAQRQNDGLLDLFPIWSDVCTFDGKPWRGIVDVISGGFPCQDISAAGKGAGIDGERSGLWGEFARIIHEVRPRFAFVENSPMLTSRGLGRVLGDLAALGFDAQWGVLSAAAVGAPHKRERIWICARRGNILSHSKHDRDRRGQQQPQGSEKKTFITNTASERLERQQWSKLERFGVGLTNGGKDVADTMHQRLQGGANIGQSESIRTERNKQPAGCGECPTGENWPVEPAVGRVAHGVAYRVDRLKAIGNGQVPQCAAEAFRQLIGRFFDK